MIDESIDKGESCTDKREFSFCNPTGHSWKEKMSADSLPRDASQERGGVVEEQPLQERHETALGSSHHIEQSCSSVGK